MAANAPPTTSASDVALQLLALVEAEDQDEALSPLRLQKLLYYVQGWSIALRGAPMFHERIQAWAHGPVVPEIFQRYKQYGSFGIPPERDTVPNLTEDQKQFIGRVWKTYRQYSALALSDMTHEEDPWRHARGPLDAAAKCSSEITLESLGAYFRKHVEA